MRFLDCEAWVLLASASFMMKSESAPGHFPMPKCRAPMEPRPEARDLTEPGKKYWLAMESSVASLQWMHRMPIMLSCPPCR